MILNKLSAWVTDANGTALPEYQTREIDNNTIECWIPSTEGSNFQIRWKAPISVQSQLDLQCVPYLDGVKHIGSFIRAGEIAKGEVGKKCGQSCGESLVRLYRFGKRKLTDDEAVAPLGLEIQKDLNTIRLELSWGRLGPPRRRTYQDSHTEAKPLHEKMAKKGHSGSAELGKPTPSRTRPATTCPFHCDLNLKPISFVFRYASQEWLQAREIVPSSQQVRDSPSPEFKPKTKRPRSVSPDIIDIDDLESDDGEVVVKSNSVTKPPNKRPRNKNSGRHVQPKLEL